VVKTSLDIPSELWQRMKHRAIDEGAHLKDLLVRALEAYLKTPLRTRDQEKGKSRRRR
jgi:hypothetical protein